ncbi:MAG: fluoride efflux transporter CrcB [Bacteroidia bacterium]|nr:MAG: fluoride efflux transporter CrcB [Bacteroidia bacterium]
MLKLCFIAGLGGFLGTVARFLCQYWVEQLLPTVFPLATFIVNIFGSFIIGMVYAIAEKGSLLSAEMRIFLAVGFCGGFTTFSSFSYNNLNLMKNYGMIYPLTNIGLSVFWGIVATYLGIIFGKFLFK